MTLLANVQDAARLAKIDVPSSVIGNTDETAALLLGLSNRGGRSIAKRYAWQALQVVAALTTLAASSQGALPANFDRIIPDTMWNTTRRRKVFGPLDAQEWAEISATVTTMVDPAFQIRAGNIYMTPTPAAGEAVIYTYASTLWVDNGGADATAYDADTNTTVFDDELLVLDLVWRYRHNRGLDFEPDRLEFERRLADAITLDGGRRTIDTTSCRMPVGQPTKLQIPDSGFA